MCIAGVWCHGGTRGKVRGTPRIQFLRYFSPDSEWRTESCDSKAIKHKNAKAVINRQKTAGREVKYLQQISM